MRTAKSQAAGVIHAGKEREISMQQTGYAYFVKRPRVMEDLKKPHLLGRKNPFMTVKTIKLSAIDYENFITDLLADRQFIEDSADLCEKGEVWRCLLVQKRGCQDGVLVLPEEGCFVGYAAYLASANQ